MRRLLPALLALLVLVPSACGGDDDGAGPAPTPVTLGLDFTPNAVHAPIYAAVREGFDAANGVDIRIRPPGSAPDSLRLLASGRADVAVLDIHDLGLARQRGADVVGVGALVQRPLGALIAREGIERPRDLEGERVGVSGLPSDPAFVRAIVENDGGDPGEIRYVTIGFAAVASLIEGRIDAAPMFWNAEGVALRQRDVPVNEFRVNDYGAPPYPEVVLVTTEQTLAARRDVVEGVVRALADGVQAVFDDPGAAVRDIVEAGGGEEELVRAQLEAVMPILTPPLRLDRDVLEDWAAWDVEVGILEEPPDVERAFEFGLHER